MLHSYLQLNYKLQITEKVLNTSVSLKEVGKLNATSTAKEADDYSGLINENKGLKLINTGTIDPYKVSWGSTELTNKGNKFLRPLLDMDLSIISENRFKLYNSKKIIIAKIGLQCEAFLDVDGNFASINTNCIHSFSNNFLPEYVLCWLNSRLFNYTFECLFDGLRMSGGYLLFSAPNLKNTYIKNIYIKNQQPFIEKANQMLSLNKDLQEITDKFLRTLDRKFEIEKLSKKLEVWHDLTYKEFVKELKKKKVKLSLAEEAEWEDYFTAEKTKADNLKTQINQTDKEIDAMVYDLYGVTEEEVAIVERS